MNNLEFKKDSTKYYLAITGHADIESAFDDEKEELGYNSTTFMKVENYIEDMVSEIIKARNIKLQDVVCISGMARGVDEIFAIYAVKHKLSLQLFIPHSLYWHQNRDPRANGTRAQAYDYQFILDYVRNKNKIGDINSVIFEIKKDYNGEIYKFANFARNQAMVDNCDNLISVLVNDSSGTEDCIRRGKKINKYLGNCIDIKKNESVKNMVKNIPIKDFNQCLKFEFNTDLFKNDLNLNVIAHGANCFQTMGSGIALWIKNTFPEAYEADLKYSTKGDRNKLGTYSLARVNSNNKNLIYVANLYTQYTMYNKDDKFDIKAFENSLCQLFNDLIKLRTEKHKEKALNIPIKIGIPPIGLGLAEADSKLVFNTLIHIAKLYENQNIKLHFCIRSKDKELNDIFKKLISNETNSIKQTKENFNIEH